MNNKLDISSLDKAIKQLKKSMKFACSDLAKQNNELFFQFRAATIQGFEFTYELAIKFLRRQLEQIEASSEIVEQLGFKDLLRLGAMRGLINSPEAWFNFREQRNITSHIYDENKAQDVYEIIPEFLEEVQFFFSALLKRNS